MKDENNNIENLIIKFLTKEADFYDLRQLELWICNPKNETLFYEYIKTSAFINMAMGKYGKKRAKANIVSRIKREKSIFRNKSKIKNIAKYAAAAIVVGILTTAYVFRDSLFDTQLNTTPTNCK